MAIEELGMVVEQPGGPEEQMLALLDSEEEVENGLEPPADVDGRDDDAPGVTIEELRSIVKHEIQDAIDYAEEDLAERRINRQKAYQGDLYEEDDKLDDTRSTVISRDVHDTVHAIIPSIMRIFCGGDSPVEFTPVGLEDVAFAAQATCYVNDIVLEVDNDFYNVMYSASHDALVKGLGVFKWWWEKKTRVEGSYYSGLSETAFQMLAAEEGVEIDDFEEVENTFDLQGGPLIDCHVARTTTTNGRVVIEAVPPEERLINRDARTIDDSEFYGHRSETTVSKLTAMGFNYDQIVRMSGNAEIDTNEEAVERYDNQAPDGRTAATADPSQREIEVVECFINVDLDGDGIAEKYRIYCGGEAFSILEWNDGDLAIDLCDEITFAELCPDPIPHNATGKAISDKVMDIQRVKTNLLRGTLDSLSRSIFPREEIVDGQVNIDDAMNPEIGAMIRVRAPGMIREIVTPFMGKECLPVLGYMDEVKADRTGISDATMGLNPQTLQSSTEGAVDNAISAGQTQIELIARHFSNGVKRLFKGVLQTIKQNQDQARTVRLRNEWVDVDPAAWNAGMDAQPAVALGRGTEQDRIKYLMLIAGKQEAIMQQMGPQNGLVTMAEYRNTMDELVKASGYFHSDKFFLPVQLGEQVQQLKTQLDEQTKKNTDLEQRAALMQKELSKRSASAANKDDATAEQSRAGAFEKVVSGVHEAGEAVVSGLQFADEYAASKIITAKPTEQPQGPQQ